MNLNTIQCVSISHIITNMSEHNKISCHAYVDYDISYDYKPIWFYGHKVMFNYFFDGIWPGLEISVKQSILSRLLSLKIKSVESVSIFIAHPRVQGFNLTEAGLLSAATCPIFFDINEMDQVFNTCLSLVPPTGKQYGYLWNAEARLQEYLRVYRKMFDFIKAKTEELAN